MEPNKILYIINQKSGNSDNNNLQNVIHNVMVEKDILYELFVLTGNDDAKIIRDKISLFGPEIVVAGGGDGTINFVASVILDLPVKLGFIPLGSANGLTSELGIPLHTEDALQHIISGNAKALDVVRINQDNISLHLSDLGINARIVKEFEREGKRGFSGYFKHFFKELFKPQKSFKCSIYIDDRIFKHHAYMIIIANASSYGTGANINPQGKMDDGKFEIIVLKHYHRWIWRSLIGAFTGSFDKQPNVEIYKCISVIIEVTPAQDLQIDGESMGKTSKVQAFIIKHALNVIY